MPPDLKLLVQVFIHNAATAVRMISGRRLSMAEMGAIAEQATVAVQTAYLRGKLAGRKVTNANPDSSTLVRHYDRLFAERQRPDPGFDDATTLPNTRTGD